MTGGRISGRDTERDQLADRGREQVAGKKTGSGAK